MVTRSRVADVIIFLVLTVFTVTFFLLQVTNSNLLATSFGSALIIIVYCIIAIFSLVVLLFANLFSDAGKNYYQNLKPLYVFYIFLFAGLMYLVSVISASVFPASLQPLSSIPGQTSVTTSVISDILFTYTVVALAEELLKFAGYTEFKAYYKKLGPFLMWLIALTPVLLWAGFHAIQAYNNFWYLIPAFVDGMLLLALLELTHAFLAPVIAHGTYNAILTVTSYLTTPSNLPLFPTVFTASDGILALLCLLWIVLGIVIPAWLGAKENQKTRTRFR